MPLVTTWTITAYVDTQDTANPGWAYRIVARDTDGEREEESGALDAALDNRDAAEAEIEALADRTETVYWSPVVESDVGDGSFSITGDDRVFVHLLAVTEAVETFCAGADDDGPDANSRRIDMMDAVSAAMRAGATIGACSVAVVQGVDHERADLNAVLTGLGLPGLHDGVRS